MIDTSVTTFDAGRPDPVEDPFGFFESARRAFVDLLARQENSADTLVGLAERAFVLFDKGVARRADDLCAVACHGGCASCCTIRVIATAPEVLAVAHSIRSAPRDAEVELGRRISAADGSTRRLDESQRLAAGIVCPFVEHGLCAVYPVRPLACRGHVSFDAQACIDVLAGQPCEVPVSTVHLIVRCLVQNAMQSALRSCGYPWGAYELNQALHIALSDDTAEARWTKGEDIFASAMITEVSPEEMAATFDALEARSR